MKYLLLTVLLCTPFIAKAQNYPPANRTPNTLNTHGLEYHDDYAWLEQMAAPEVQAWVDAQNRLLQSHLGKISSEVYPLPTLRKYDDKTNYRLPQKKGAYYYSLVRYANEEKQTPTLTYKKTLTGASIALVNPNFFYNNKTVNVVDYSPSQQSEILAYKLMIDGSDQHEVRFVTIQNGKKHKEVLKNVKFTSLAWKGDEGIFYNKNSNASQFAADSTYQVYYHKVGDDIKNDRLIFDATEMKGQLHYFTSHEGDKFFLVVSDRDEKHTDMYHADLNAENFELKKLEARKAGYKLLGYHSGKMFVSTKDSNWGDVRYFELEDPATNKIIIPQYQNQLLVDVNFYENRIVCKYKNTDGSYFMVFDYDGKFIGKVQGPKGMDVSLLGEDYHAKETLFSVSSYTVPHILFNLVLETAKFDRYVNNTFTKTTAPFPIDHFTTVKTTYTARDGVQVPITIVYKKDMALNGNNPTLLEAYGGFGSISSPHYDNALVYFMNSGGVYAYAEIRGGGDKGFKWHKDGTKLKKINTINDFIDAAEYLIKQNYTSANRLAITGGSQGGLLVGAAMVKRPELFKVAIPDVGVYDMARFHDYTVGRFHYDEYGDPEVKEEFQAMMAYSPYHNIKEDVNYPTTLIMTSDNDDRVPPIHSYKFAARLQDRPAQTNPVYLKTRRNAGHYGITTNHDDKLEEKSEFYSFLLYHLKK
ncbi:prolyl oligopeptidase family serine peptidase [Flavobacterium sp. MFBS3-15]|uniref:prolyl oligopeptidase family serine peptidase n=1 Tax=Flavobacterium sp. MFBS3-15 TaxID=2989816 RepID=UPI00223652DA|nr:prolyl oligopeptidase family serine peptidase [Flavobacterium sp. MFBS3-15]MCW4469186.1 prolyl oligopeptidase family serine peptidase [Flavobacterium sp. MFBS3-15]